jgi:hypothetical protein
MAIPQADLLDKKLSLYMISPHGGASPGDRNSLVVPKNIHVFAQSYRKDTYYNPRIGYDVANPRFSGIRYIWKEKIDKKYSINDLLTNIMHDTGMVDDSYYDYAYYPPGCSIRNLTLSRDSSSYNIDGIFKIGDQKPFALLKIMPGVAGLPADDFTYKSKIYDHGQPNYDPTIPVLDTNDTTSAIGLLKDHGDTDEEKIILILACASEPGRRRPTPFAGEGDIQKGNLKNTIYHSKADPTRLNKIDLNRDNSHLAKIRYILENNVLYNDRLHINIDIPIECDPIVAGILCFKFRSRKSFNSLLRKIKPFSVINPEDEPRLPTHLLIKDGNIKQINESMLTTEILPYILIKIPKGFNKFLFSPTYNMIQFFKSYENDNDPLTIAPISPSTVEPVVGPVVAKVGGNYYEKYLKYKLKYINIKG